MHNLSRSSSSYSFYVELDYLMMSIWMHKKRICLAKGCRVAQKHVRVKMKEIFIIYVIIRMMASFCWNISWQMPLISAIESPMKRKDFYLKFLLILEIFFPFSATSLGKTLNIIKILFLLISKTSSCDLIGNLFQILKKVKSLLNSLEDPPTHQKFSMSALKSRILFLNLSNVTRSSLKSVISSPLSSFVLNSTFEV